jgi:hypothetical protein
MELDLDAIRQLAEEDPDAAKEMVRKYRKAMIVLARNDPSWFCQYVLKNRDGGMIRQQPHHHAMHKSILENQRSLIWTFPEAGKSTQVAIGHVLWRLGKDPNRTFGILSNAAQMAANIVSAMKCEVRGTSVLKADGSWARIESLVEWTKLLTLDTRTMRYVEVTGRSAYNSNERCFRIELDSGQVMHVTENHPLLVLDGAALVWRPARDIKAGNSVVAVRNYTPKELTSPEEIPPEAAELIGYLLTGRLADETMVLRKMNRQPGWIARRSDFFSKLGWTVKDNGRWSVRVSGGDTTPAEYAKQVVTFENGWPVDVHPAVWALDDTSICRLLSALWSAGFLKSYENTRNRNGFLGGSIGLGNSRVPSHIEHVNRPTLDLFRRLFMRAGVRARITKSKYTAFADLGGICRRDGSRYKDLYRLSIESADIGRFWPVSATRHAERPDHYLEKVVRVFKMSMPQETWALEVQESQHSYISGGILSHNTYIAESPELHDVFPELKPGDRWAANSFTVQRSTIRKDPSVTAIGLTGKFLGARFDGLVLDDVDSVETVLTPEARNLTERIVRTKALSRLSEDGWAVAIGNVWDKDDLMHRLEKTGWKSLRFPVMDAKTGQSNDPENFPLERIYAIRDEDQGPLEFSRLYMLEPRAEGEERFRMEWIEGALLKGRQSSLLKEGLIKVPPGCRTVTGVDLGVKKKASSDPTAVITVLEIPTSKERSDYQLLNIEFGRWNAHEIMEKIAEQQRLFNSEVWVESNGCFVPGTQVLTASGYKPIETIEPGELVWTHQNRWRKVLHRHDGTARYVVTPKTHGNLPVTCTPNHAFYVSRAERTPGRNGGHWRPTNPTGWCSIGFPDTEMFLRVAVPTWPDCAATLELSATKQLAARTIDVDEQLAAVLGLFMAEGHTSNGYVHWTLNKSETYIADFITQTMQRHGFVARTYARQNTLRVTIGQKQLARLLKIGKHDRKCLPLKWMGWPVELRLALIRGWFIGDGCVEKNGTRRVNPSLNLTGCTVSRDWAMFVRSTLHQAGIPSSIACKVRRKPTQIAGRTIRGKPIYCIRLADSASQRLRSLMSLPVESAHWDKRWFVSVRSNISGTSTILQSGEAWTRLLPYSQTASETYEFYDDGPVHNLTVEEDHSFTVEDFVVHNAQDMLIQLMNMSGRSCKVNAFYTGRNKYDPMYGVESLANELAMGCWTIPSWEGNLESTEPEVKQLCDEMYAYMPNKHTGDLLMALWIAREGARTSKSKSDNKVEFGRIRLRR